MVSVLQHPDGSVQRTFIVYLFMSDSRPYRIHVGAPPPASSNASNTSDDANSSKYTSVLGIVPHQLRGFLSQWRTMQIVGSAYDKCTGCGEAVSSFFPLLCESICVLIRLLYRQVLQAYLSSGFDMLLQAFNDPKYLESLTGLDKLQEEARALDEEMEAVEWDEDED